MMADYPASRSRGRIELGTMRKSERRVPRCFIRRMFARISIALNLLPREPGCVRIAFRQREGKESVQRSFDAASIRARTNSSSWPFVHRGRNERLVPRNILLTLLAYRLHHYHHLLRHQFLHHFRSLSSVVLPLSLSIFRYELCQIMRSRAANLPERNKWTIVNFLPQEASEF